MKLKYYLRGLGVGIVVTAIIMSITGQPEKLTDAQIKMRALELGMVEETVLADLQKKEEEDLKDEKIPLDEVLISGGEALIGEDLEVEEGFTEENVSQTTSETLEEENSEEENVSVQDDDNFLKNNDELSEQKDAMEMNDMNISSIIQDNEAIEKYIIITVEGGNGSEVVSRRLFEAGLVDSAIGYNQYLIDNGYSRILKAGNHEIPVDATEEEMAKILCGLK